MKHKHYVLRSCPGHGYFLDFMPFTAFVLIFLFFFCCLWFFFTLKRVKAARQICETFLHVFYLLLPDSSSTDCNISWKETSGNSFFAWNSNKIIRKNYLYFFLLDLKSFHPPKVLVFGLGSVKLKLNFSLHFNDVAFFLKIPKALSTSWITWTVTALLCCVTLFQSLSRLQMVQDKKWNAQLWLLSCWLTSLWFLPGWVYFLL